MNSPFVFTPNIWPLIGTGLLLFVLSTYSLRRRSVPGALPFAIGCLLAAVWVTGSILEIAAVDVATKVSWVKFQGLWQLPASTAVTCFILEYAWPGRWLTRRNLALLSIAPLLALVLILTNDFHHLSWTGFTFEGSIILQLGPVIWVFITYANTLGFVELIVFIYLFIHTPQLRGPVSVMLLGQLVARTTYLLVLTRVIRSPLPLDVLGISFLFMMYAIALFGFRIFDPIPMARQMAIDQLHAGVLVLSPEGRLINLNPTAEWILGRPANRARGQFIWELLPAYPHDQPAICEDVETEFSLETERDVRHYTMTISRLKDFRGLETGSMLLLRDVTEQKHAQEQFIEQQRALAMLHEREILARELHDSLGQVFAFVNTQGQTIRRLLSRGDLTTADEYIRRLVDVAREADVDIRESILGLRVTLSQHGFLPALTEYLERYEKNYGIHTELVKSEPFADGIFEPLVEVELVRILQEALTNVRKHSAAHCVRISFARADHCVRVTVQDDGQGFDLGSQLDELSEHLGLRVMRERAEEVGGALSLRSEPGQGTEVVVQVPVKEESSKGGRDV